MKRFLIHTKRYLNDFWKEVKEVNSTFFFFYNHESAIQIYELKFAKYMKISYAIMGFISFIILILEYGFHYDNETEVLITSTVPFIIGYLVIYEIVSYIFSYENAINYAKEHIIETFVVFLVFIEVIFKNKIILSLNLGDIGSDKATIAFLSISQFSLLFSSFARFLRRANLYQRKSLNPYIVFSLSFLLIIILGTIVLHLPKARQKEIPSIDIIFTAFSATCVTGLSTVHINDSFTRVGHVMIMLLIQIGGIGLMTLTSFFALFLSGRSSVLDGVFVKDLFSQNSLGKVSNILKQITFYTITIEGFGAFLLYFSLPNNMEHGENERIFYSIFHSISAFCNAGFSLYPLGLEEVALKDSKIYLSTIMVLIVLGGIGFPALNEVYIYLKSLRNKQHYLLSISTRLVLFTTAILITLGTIAYLILERKHSLYGMNFLDQVFHSLFYSISTRTAGFNSVNVSNMNTPIVFFTLLLMWIGASPVSTGGGIKTTTAALAYFNILNQLRGKPRLEIFYREIAPESVYRANATIVLSLFVIFTSIFAIISIEDLDFLKVAYEVVSAYATVGLSMGITESLSEYSKALLCIVMFVGRVGILSVLLCFFKQEKSFNYKYPKDFIIIG
jgi:trk system potassium uptake protein TrkH